MERSEFYRLAERHKDMIFRIALGYFGNIPDAEDAVQEVLVKLYTAPRPFQNDEHVRYWLIRVTINLCKNALRSPWRRKRVSLDELSAAIQFQEPAQSDLFLTVMSLPEKYRTVLYLFYYEDCSVKDIALLLDLSQSAVTTRLSRARRALKQELMEVPYDG